MKRTFYILSFCFLLGFLNAQNCQEQLLADSLYKPAEKKSVAVKAITCKLKSGGKIQLIDANGKYFLKLNLHDKLGFVEAGSLEIKSGSKSFFVRNTTLYNIKEDDAYFIIDVMINYISTLKEDGITTVVFNSKFESKLSKEDISNIKKAAKCFYELYKK